MGPTGPPEWVVVLLIGLVAGLPITLALTAIVAGLRALRVIRDSAGGLRGRGMALAGIVCGAGGLLFGALAATGVGVAWLASPKSLERKSNTELAALAASGGVRQRGAARALAARGAEGRDLLLAALADPAKPESERLAAFIALRDAGAVQWRDQLGVLLHIMGGTAFELQSELGPLLTWSGGIRPVHVVPFLLDDDAQRRAGAVATINAHVQSTGWGLTPLSAAELPGLIRALEQSADREVRLAVIAWLEGMGPRARSALPALKAAAADDSDADVKTTAASAVQTIGK